MPEKITGVSSKALVAITMSLAVFLDKLGALA
jgi:hypothetical protein